MVLELDATVVVQLMIHATVGHDLPAIIDAQRSGQNDFELGRETI